MNQDTNIILDKELRRDIDAIIQRLKLGTGELNTPPVPVETQRRSRERALAITKLQEAVMWLGMDLKAINDENQPNEAAIEKEAILIYDAMRVNDPEGANKPWVSGGNSLKQDEARRAARAKLSLCGNPYPNSKDPTNTKIDPTADGLKL